MEAVSSLTDKLNDCCSAVPLGHCGTIDLPKGFAPIGDQDPPNRWTSAPPSGGGPVNNSGIRVQIIAAGFFVRPNPDREVLEPVVTIHNQGDELMYVGRYTQSPTFESFHTHFRVPPGASVTVTWWTLWNAWASGGPPGGELAVTGKNAKGCYVLSWCCPVQAKIDVDVPVTVNVPEYPPYYPERNPAPEDPAPEDPATAAVGRRKARRKKG